MGMDISFFKVNKKDWDAYSKSDRVDVNETTEHGYGWHCIGESKGCPEMVLIGEFRNCYEMVPNDQEELCLFEVTRERIEELYEYYDKHNINIASWFLFALNTFTDEDALVMYYF